MAASPEADRRAVAAGCDPPPAAPRLDRPRLFFAAWRIRNERRAALWEEGTSAAAADRPLDSRARLSTLHLKLEHLKSEISGLVEQDIALFRQLFALQEAILDLREQFEATSCSSGDSSPCSTISSSSSLNNLGVFPQHSSSFVRHHVSYPPIARNRSYRIKSSPPQHGCQDSYDSGIHTSDHEIFV